MAKQTTKKPATRSAAKSTTPVNSDSAKPAGAGAALAERSKDASGAKKQPASTKGKSPAGKGKATAAKPTSATSPAKASRATSAQKEKPSLVKRMARSVKATAVGAVDLAASVIGSGKAGKKS